MLRAISAQGYYGYMKKAATTVAFVMAGAIAINFITTSSNAGKTPQAAAVEAFAKCLKDNGVKLYMMGLPAIGGYMATIARVVGVECMAPDGDQTPECAAKDFAGYPMWELRDGTHTPGPSSAQAIGRLSGCLK